MPKLRLKYKKAKKSTAKTGSKFTGLRRKLLSQKSLIVLLIILTLAGFSYSGQYWFKNSYLDKQKVFYDMLDRSLDTTSVTRTVQQIASGRTEDQSIVVQFSPEPVTHSISRIEQITQSRTKSVVVTENYGLKDQDFVRYNEVSIPQSGQPVDYTKILNTWAKQTKDANSGASAAFLNDSAFTFIPFGNFPGEQRNQIINQIKDNKVYKIDSEKISYRDFRPVYTASVSINPHKFVKVMREYAKFTGIGNLDQLDPDQYADQHIFTIFVEVDALSRHLTSIKYGGADRVENYDSYGLTHKLLPPKSEDTITVEELQSKLQQ